MRVCNRCVMDETDLEIEFDEKGICNRCKEAEGKIYEANIKKYDLGNIVRKIKEESVGKPYDVVLGLSGGKDSSTALYKIVELGLIPLVSIYDNGWDTEIAKHNQLVMIKGTGSEYEVVGENLDEFYALQKAFLQASVPDVEVPTDHALVSNNFDIAEKYGVQTIVTGCNVFNESIRIRGWSRGHYDWKYIRKVFRKKSGERRDPEIVHRSKKREYFLKQVKGIRTFDVLNYLDYDPDYEQGVLSEKYGWKWYGGKHCESIYTRWATLFYIAKKFGYDKRKANFSSLIVSGKMKREDALEQLRKPAWEYTEVKEDTDLVREKLLITRGEFEEIMNAPKKSYFDYPHSRKVWDPRGKRK